MGTVALYTIYTAAYRKHIDSLLFDRKLAKAEVLELDIKQQRIVVPVFSIISTITGLWISFLLDLPDRSNSSVNNSADGNSTL